MSKNEQLASYFHLKFSVIEDLCNDNQANYHLIPVFNVNYFFSVVVWFILANRINLLNNF